MRLKVFSFILSALFGLATSVGAADQAIPLTQLPPTVQATVKHQLGAGRLGDIEK
ncbi:MAG TPA: hypothetical protein VLT36_08040 [Candidatus Dormibacteraeota bacterium]|nr:hypothetical protein [Candidatus Dormibacteraeota bacterium]